MNGIVQNILSSISGNIPKAILCVRQAGGSSIKETVDQAVALQKKLLQSTESALNGLSGSNMTASQTFSSITSGGPQSAMAGSGFLALEVQYNPSSIQMSTQAGKQVDYSGGNLGTKSTNQITQINAPVATTMSFDLVFDDMNPQDAFMLENIAPTVGNVVSEVGKIVRNNKAGGYSVQAQIDGLMALLAREDTRQVIFFWSKMCFRGEVTNVSSRYVMFNKQGNPIRGIVTVTIRQGTDSRYKYDEQYWDQAFTKAFGAAGADAVSGAASAFSKATNNNFLNLNL